METLNINFEKSLSQTILVEVVDMTTILAEQFIDVEGTEKRLREKTAAQIAVSRMFGPTVKITHAPDGHPILDGIAGSLSISHARNLLVAVYSPTSTVGVDIEYPRDALHRVASKFLSETELNQCVSTESLLRAWTIKEAVYKAMLQKGLSLFAIHLPDPENKNPDSVVKTGRDEIRFDLFYGKIGEAFVTLAVRVDA